MGILWSDLSPLKTRIFFSVRDPNVLSLLNLSGSNIKLWKFVLTIVEATLTYFNWIPYAPLWALPQPLNIYDPPSQKQSTRLSLLSTWQTVSSKICPLATQPFMPPESCIIRQHNAALPPHYFWRKKWFKIVIIWQYPNNITDTVAQNLCL